MKWLFIFLLSLVGVFLGWADVYLMNALGLQLLWLAVSIAYSFVLFRFIGSNYFLFGMLLGAGCCTWVAAMHLLLFKDYLHRHADVGRIMASLPTIGDRYGAMLLIDLAKGLFLAFVMGCFAFVVPRAMKR